MDSTEELQAEVERLRRERDTAQEWFEAADAAADRRLDQSIKWMERAEAAEAKLRAVEALADAPDWSDEVGPCVSVGSLRAVLAQAPGRAGVERGTITCSHGAASSDRTHSCAEADGSLAVG